MTYSEVGKNADPVFRSARARRAALARTSLDQHIAKVVAAAPELTAEQIARLSVLLRPGAATAGVCECGEAA